MFDLITGHAQHIPQRPALPILISATSQALLVGALVLPVLLVTGQLPQTPTMLAFVAAPPAPPPPPPPPPPPAAQKQKPPDTPPVPNASAAPVDMPTRIQPELFDDEGEEGVPGGVEGGIPGGVIGGVLGGLLTEIPPPPPPAPAAPRAPVRTGGNVQAPALITRVEPVYPPMAVHSFMQGTVILEALVDEDGTVDEVQVLRSAGKILDEAAIDAVKQWRYEPLLLNGIRAPFILSVVLSFKLTTKG
jgi:protein TonB